MWDWEVKEKAKQEIKRKKIDFEREQLKQRFQWLRRGKKTK